MEDLVKALATAPANERRGAGGLSLRIVRTRRSSPAAALMATAGAARGGRGSAKSITSKSSRA